MNLRNQKGFTTIELLISLFILALVLTASISFYDFYKTKNGDFGAYNTARNLAVSALEQQMESTRLGNATKTGQVYQQNVYVNGNSYDVIVTQSDATDVASYYNHNIPFYSLNSKVIFDNKSVEVNAYVTTK
jgi:prepilin-type N-terminal cleavage/methylation domain-containing protein